MIMGSSASCSKGSLDCKKDVLLVSLSPYITLVKQIVGDEFEVKAVVPPGADPHHYEPTSKQLQGLLKGKILFGIGESFEKKLLPLLPCKKVDLASELPLIHSSCSDGCHHDLEDRHIWLSPKLLILQVNKINQTLCTEFPEKKELFEKNSTSLIYSLEKLDQDLTKLLSNVDQKAFLISHPAFAYFCKDYSCEQISLEMEGKESKPKDIETAIEKAKKCNAKVAIAIPQHNNKGSQIVAQKLHIPVRYIDPYSAQYETTLKKLAALVENPYQSTYE